jgi:hypothetical protein
MRCRSLSYAYGLAVATAVAASLTSLTVAGQTPAPDAKPAKSWTAQRTPWGDPDLQGMWTNFDETPFEQPNPDPAAAAAARERGAKLFGTERRKFDAKGNFVTGGPSTDPMQAYGSPTSPLRPSLIVDPPTGLTPLKPGVAEYRDHDLYLQSWTYQSPGERCITRGLPNGMFPYRYNNGHQILQGPGVVVIFSEMIHDARVIPVDGRPHVGAAIRLWNGDSRGHWEGNTLVVDTTNFNDRGVVRFASGIVQPPQTESLHLVERFTRVNANTIDYRVTIEDPNVFTRAWTVALPYNNDPSYQIYEYACHEGNTRYMEGVLSGGGGRFKLKSGGETPTKTKE